MSHIVKSLFGKPRCSECNGVVVETGYYWPYPAYRCPNCYNRNKEKREQQESKSQLEERIAKLENQLKQKGEQNG